VQANLLAAEAAGVTGEVYNVACGRSTSLLDLVALLNGLLGTCLQPTHAAPRPGDVRDSRAALSQAPAGLGYAPAPDLPEGLRRYLAYCAARSGWLRQLAPTAAHAATAPQVA